MKKLGLSLALMSSFGFANEINISTLINSDVLQSKIISNNQCYSKYNNNGTQKEFLNTKGSELLAYKLKYDKFPNYNVYSSIQKDFESKINNNFDISKILLCETENFEDFVNLNKETFKEANVEVLKVNKDYTTSSLTNVYQFGQTNAGLFVDKNLKVFKLAKNTNLNNELKIGDKITYINGNKIKSLIELEETLNKLKAGEKCSISYERNKKQHTSNFVFEPIYTLDKSDLILSKTKDTLKLMPFGGFAINPKAFDLLLESIINENQYKTIYVDTRYINILQLSNLLNFVSNLTNKDVFIGIKNVNENQKHTQNIGLIGKQDSKAKHRNIIIQLDEKASSAAKLFAYIAKNTDNSVKIETKNFNQVIETPKEIIYHNEYMIIKPSKEIYVVQKNKEDVVISNKTLKELLKK